MKMNLLRAAVPGVRSQESGVDSAEVPFDETSAGAACSAWRRSGRLWEPQATPLQGRSLVSGFFSEIRSQESIPLKNPFSDEKLGARALLAAPEAFGTPPGAASDSPPGPCIRPKRGFFSAKSGVDSLKNRSPDEKLGGALLAAPRRSGTPFLGAASRLPQGQSGQSRGFSAKSGVDSP